MNFITFVSSSPRDFQEETRRSWDTILNYPRETISRMCCEASGRDGVSPSVLGRLTGAVQHGSEWRQSRIKCDLAVQTAVALKKIRYVSDSVPHLKVAWFWFENVRFNVVLFTLSKANQIQGTCMLQSERSLSGLYFSHPHLPLNHKSLCYRAASTVESEDSLQSVFLAFRKTFRALPSH